MQISRALATTATLLVLIMAAGCDDWQGSWPKRKFDVQQWKASDHDERYVFANDLLDGRLIGLTEEEIKAQLGRPTSETSRILLYDIRESEPGTMQYIYINLDENKRASNAGIGSSD